MLFRTIRIPEGKRDGLLFNPIGHNEKAAAAIVLGDRLYMGITCASLHTMPLDKATKTIACEQYPISCGTQFPLVDACKFHRRQ